MSMEQSFHRRVNTEAEDVLEQIGEVDLDGYGYEAMDFIREAEFTPWTDEAYALIQAMPAEADYAFETVQGWGAVDSLVTFVVAIANEMFQEAIYERVNAILEARGEDTI